MVAFVAQGVYDLQGGEGFACAAGPEQEQPQPLPFHFRKVQGVVFSVIGNFGAATVVVVKVPLVHVGVGYGVAAAGVCFQQLVLFTPFFFLLPVFFDPAVAGNGKGPLFAQQLSQHVFGLVADAAVKHAVFYVIFHGQYTTVP